MAVKNKDNAFGYRLLLFIYKIVGYRAVAILLNFIAIYYLLFARDVKQELQSYYKHQNIKLTNYMFFKHIKTFANSIFDRFVSRIDPNSFNYNGINEELLQILNEKGGIVLLSHVGGWASSTHNLQTKDIPPMNVVMQDNTNQNMQDVEQNTKDNKKENVNIIDLNMGAFAANIQIANVLMKNEIVAMMADRVANEKRSIEVSFFGSKVKINKDPFDIAKRIKKPIIIVHTINKGDRNYDALYYEVPTKDKSIEQTAQYYMSVLEDTLKKYPQQWFNFYDYFK
ncbi:MAG: lysophospholipid acyltransferase family protein [Sulfurimonas sp.]|nr:lysophospholipid acyltransferase family protein [Sulfurimonas sp.]